MLALRITARLSATACIALFAAQALAQGGTLDRPSLADARISHLEALVQQLQREQYDHRIAVQQLLADNAAHKRLVDALGGYTREQSDVMATLARGGPRLADYALVLLAAVAAWLAFLAWKIHRQLGSLVRLMESRAAHGARLPQRQWSAKARRS